MQEAATLACTRMPRQGAIWIPGVRSSAIAGDRGQSLVTRVPPPAGQRGTPPAGLARMLASKLAVAAMQHASLSSVAGRRREAMVAARRL